MSKKPDMGLDTDAYLADTGHLSTLQHGAYLLLLMAMHRSEDGWLPGDDNYLARASRLTLGRWKQMATTIRALLIETGGRVSQKRVQKDRRAAALSPGVGIPSENPSRPAKPLKSNGPDSKPAPRQDSALTGLFKEGLELDDSKRSESKRVRATILPKDWEPADAERLYARTVCRLTDREVETAAEQMRRWARANAHLSKAHKADWPATFRNWLDEFVRRGRQGPPRGSGARAGTASGYSQIVLQAMQQGDDHGERNGSDEECFGTLPAPHDGHHH